MSAYKHERDGIVYHVGDRLTWRESHVTPVILVECGERLAVVADMQGRRWLAYWEELSID